MQLSGGGSQEQRSIGASFASLQARRTTKSQVGPVTAVSAALGHQVGLVKAVSVARGRRGGSGTVVLGALGRQVGLVLVAWQAGWPGRAGQAGSGRLILAQGRPPRAALDAKLAQERRFREPLDVKLALERRFRRPLEVKLALERQFCNLLSFSCDF